MGERDTLNRILTLGLMSAEIAIDGGGFIAALPRNKSKERFDRLLASLGEPPIAWPSIWGQAQTFNFYFLI